MKVYRNYICSSNTFVLKGFIGAYLMVHTIKGWVCSPCHFFHYFPWKWKIFANKTHHCILQRIRVDSQEAVQSSKVGLHSHFGYCFQCCIVSCLLPVYCDIFPTNLPDEIMIPYYECLTITLYIGSHSLKWED